MTLLFIRCVLVYFFTLFAIRIMGKRQLGQLQPFELVIVLIISELATMAIQSNKISLIDSVMPILTIMLLQVLLSLLNLKSEKMRNVFCGRPAILIEKGRFCEHTMARQRINLNDLQEMCRAQGYFDLAGIDYAIMETNGHLSVLPKTDKRPLQVSDMLTEVPLEQIGELFVLDGHVNQRGLKAAGLDGAWLQKQLKAKRIDRPEDLFVAGTDENGEFFLQKKETGLKR